MNNFVYFNPVKIVFGKDTIAELDNLVPPSARVLLTFGGGSIKKNGVYDQIMAALAGRQVIEFGGIEPNPDYDTLMRAVEVVRSQKIDFLLAAGGGSVMDGTKFIAAASLYEGSDPWALVTGQDTAQQAIPIGVVVTLPASGSETNGTAVISRRRTQEKLVLRCPFTFPKFSILDPSVTFSLPARQIRNGVVDAFIHTTEQYITYPADVPLQDRQAEAIMVTLIEEGLKTLANPKDYIARANMMWCATQALIGVIRCGAPADFSVHGVGHELTAFYGIEHAESLAIVLPALYRHQRGPKAEKLIQYARRVWGLQGSDRDTLIEGGIRKTEGFFHAMGMPTHFSDYGIDAVDAASKVSQRLASRGTLLGERQSITPQDVAEILRMGA